MKDNKYNSHSVVTNEAVEDKKEVIAVDINGQVEDVSLDYNEYRDELSLTYKKTRIDNSIVSTFSINNDTCKHCLLIKDKNGENIIKDRVFNYNDNFIKGFLIPMVEDYRNENLLYDSTIEILGENQANFVTRTKLNDSLIILGSSVEVAKQLKDIISKNTNVNVVGEEKLDNKGIGSFVAIGLLFVAMLMLLVGIILVVTRI